MHRIFTLGEAVGAIPRQEWKPLAFAADAWSYGI
jgi:hypothetical protein